MSISRLSIVKFLELYWNDYKSKLKSKVASARASLHRTGGGPSNEGRLSDLDLKFLQILGEDFGAGLAGARVEPSFNIALTCSCVALHYHSYNAEPETGMLVTGTFVGYLIIFAGAAAGYIMQTPSHKRIDIFYSLVGVALFVASGAMIIDKWQHAGKSDFRDKNLAKASLAIINGAVLLVDAVLTQRGG